MADMKFFMGNVIIIIALAFSFAYTDLGAVFEEDFEVGDAEELVEQGVYDSLSEAEEELDFDTRRLEFDLPDEDFIYEYDRGLVWDGSTETDWGDAGFVKYDVSDIDTTIAVSADTGWFSQIFVYLDDEDDPEKAIRDGRNFIDVSDADELIFVLRSEYQMLLDVYDVGDGEEGEMLSFEDYIEDEGVVDRELEIDEGAFAQITSVLRTGVNIVVAVPQMIFGWIVFATAIPGLAGTIFRIYLSVFIMYFLVDKIWIG